MAWFNAADAQSPVLLGLTPAAAEDFDGTVADLVADLEWDREQERRRALDEDLAETVGQFLASEAERRRAEWKGSYEEQLMAGVQRRWAQRLLRGTR